MDRYLVPLSPPAKPASSLTRRPRWKRSLVELNGKFEPRYRHDILGLLMQSYSEIGLFSHLYHIGGVQCPTHMNWFHNGVGVDNPMPFKKQGISALEFDSKGIYLVSATREGCLTVHDFETLYSQVNFDCPGSEEDETKHLLHLSTQQLDVVRWNLANQDEVACTSLKNSEVHIFDIGYISSDPVEVLKKRPAINIHGFDIHRGLSDIAFSSNDSRVFASDTCGVINAWDRRTGYFPCFTFTSNSNSILNSIRLTEENQVLLGAGKNGIIYMWDLRGGRSSPAFQNHKEPHYSPLTSIKLASVLEKVGSLKAQSNIVSKEIHSIDIDPSCPYQLAFHLDDGWSGVLNIHNFQVTHIHCPPPPWLDGNGVFTDLLCLRKPSWVPTFSIYAVGSAYNDGIHLLDFYPDPSSPCHVDYRKAFESDLEKTSPHKQNKFVPLSEGVTACSTHPLNGTIVAGTKKSSLLIISQNYQTAEDR